MGFYETYYYAQALTNILDDPFEYLNSLHAWTEDEGFEALTPPFPKYTRFHSFARFIVHTCVLDDLKDISGEEAMESLWLDAALAHHGFKHEKFKDYIKERDLRPEQIDEDVLNDYYTDMFIGGPFEDLLDQIADELFTLMFANRAAMASFNEYAALRLSHLRVEECPEEYRSYMNRNGVLNRCHIPEWVQRAVFFRDKGACSSCRCDLTGLMTLMNEKNFDHIIPLAQGGLNDVTNIQLLCDKCNGKKSDHRVLTSSTYERWFSPQ